MDILTTAEVQTLVKVRISAPIMHHTLTFQSREDWEHFQRIVRQWRKEVEFDPKLQDWAITRISEEASALYFSNQPSLSLVKRLLTEV